VNTYAKTACLLEEKGYEVDYSGGVRMPANYINLYNTHTQKTNNRIMEKSAGLLRKISADIYAVRKTGFPRGFIILRFPMALLYGLFKKFSGWMGTMYHADEKCSRCGVCIKACPVGNITPASDGKPSWDSRCEQCVRCIHLCPEAAVQWLFVTKGRRRYLNPKVDVSLIYDENTPG
jgi:Pyruvate/2-oxoacid:ferredoxin oxidoreductase delta subunit